MNTAIYIARRYFFSRENKSTVNIITAISLLGLLVGTAALIIVLSAMNGLESLVRANYNTFDPDLNVTLAEGKYFSADSIDLESIKSIEGVSAISQVLEERAVLNYRDKEHIATLKGVDSTFTQVSNVSGAVLHGDFNLSTRRNAGIVMGTGVGYYLGYSRIDLGEPLSAFVLQANASAANFSNAFTTLPLLGNGLYSVQSDFDTKYALIDLNYLQGAVQRPRALNKLEIKVANYKHVDAVKDDVQKILGNQFVVKNRDEQQAVFYKVMQSEGLFAYLIFALILSIATFTIMGSLLMLMLDKKRDLHTLWALGFTIKKLRRVFFYLGMLIGGGGAIVGLLMGILLIVLQQNFGLISVGQGYLVEYYPVALEADDILLVSITVLALSSLTAFASSKRLSHRLISEN